MLPQVREGNIIEVRNVGAYGSVMASGFPGKRKPRETEYVTVRKNDLDRRTNLLINAGKGVGKALASFADDANVYGTATAGSVDDAIVAGDRVQRCKGASAVDTPSTGLAEFEMFYPFTNNGLAD